ncbi:MAG: secondary thiamine-phosphate synthase enzyme YjbQ [Lachnospiraceae bacterium]
MAILKNFKIKTTYNQVYDITEEVKQTVANSGIQEGFCIVHNMHSTAGMAVFSPWDPDGFIDLDEEIRRLVPTRVDFKHQHDTPQDAAGHVKSALLGVTLNFIVHQGKLLLGGSQGIYFLEFDGPRNREFYIKVIED